MVCPLPFAGTRITATVLISEQWHWKLIHLSVVYLSFFLFYQTPKRAKNNLTHLKVFHTLMHEFGFTMWTWMWQKILAGFSNTRLKFSSLDWLIPGFLYAIFVQRSILATELNFYPIPSPLSFITLTLGSFVSHTYIYKMVFSSFLTNYA